MQELDRAYLDGIEAFAAVAELGGFGLAAEKLERDASVISRRVTQLETRLGVRLLARTTRKVAVTEAGETYLRRVQVILEDLAATNVENTKKTTEPSEQHQETAPKTNRTLWLA